MNREQKLTTLACLFMASTLTGCVVHDDDDRNLPPAEYAAIINTVAADYSGADIELVDLHNGVFSGTLTANAAGYDTTKSDYSVAAYGQHYYRIGRLEIDAISKYSITEPNTEIYTYSTRDNPDDPDSNSQDLIFVSETKAYLLNLGTNTVWIVNPSAATEAEFKTGEIDLSQYADDDGLAEISSGVIVDGKLYITLQRLESWAVVEGNAYVAVVDITTDTEIDTTPEIESNLPGIKLQTNNPQAIIYKEDVGLFVQSIGRWSGADVYLGGIEKIDVNDYNTSIIIDDGNSESHYDYGRTSSMTLLSPTLGYFIGYHDWQENSLYQFNPTTGAVVVAAVADLDNLDIRYVTAGPDDRSLWVSIGDTVNPRVLVIDSTDNSLQDTIETTYMPEKVVFASTR